MLIKNFSTRILSGDKIGLLGPNGAGKSTILKLILGEIEADSGKVERGTKINVAYFDQMREQLDEEATLAEPAFFVLTAKGFSCAGSPPLKRLSYVGMPH